MADLPEGISPMDATILEAVSARKLQRSGEEDNRNADCCAVRSEW